MRLKKNYNLYIVVLCVSSRWRVLSPYSSCVTACTPLCSGSESLTIITWPLTTRQTPTACSSAACTKHHVTVTKIISGCFDLLLYQYSVFQFILIDVQVVLSFDASAVSELSGCDSHGLHHLPSEETADSVQFSESHTTLTLKYDHTSI